MVRVVTSVGLVLSFFDTTWVFIMSISPFLIQEGFGYLMVSFFDTIQAYIPFKDLHTQVELL